MCFLTLWNIWERKWFIGVGELAQKEWKNHDLSNSLTLVWFESSGKVIWKKICTYKKLVFS